MKTLKRNCVLAVALSALLCAGCSRGAVTPWQVKNAEDKCKNNGGVQMFEPYGDEVAGYIWCKNGAEFRVFRSDEHKSKEGT